MPHSARPGKGEPGAAVSAWTGVALDCAKTGGDAVKTTRTVIRERTIAVTEEKTVDDRV
jgi:hypothetical protein